MAEDATIIKFVRELRGITQFELAEKVGVKELTISRLERRDPRVKITTRARVADALGLSFDWATKTIKPPPDFPKEMLGGDSTCVVKLPAAVYDQLVALADNGDVAKYLADHVASTGARAVRRLPPNGRSSAGREGTRGRGKAR